MTRAQEHHGDHRPGAQRVAKPPNVLLPWRGEAGSQLTWRSRRLAKRLQPPDRRPESANAALEAAKSAEASAGKAASQADSE